MISAYLKVYTCVWEDLNLQLDRFFQTDSLHDLFFKIKSEFRFGDLKEQNLPYLFFGSRLYHDLGLPKNWFISSRKEHLSSAADLIHMRPYEKSSSFGFNFGTHRKPMGASKTQTEFTEFSNTLSIFYIDLQKYISLRLTLLNR